MEKWAVLRTTAYKRTPPIVPPSGIIVLLDYVQMPQVPYFDIIKDALAPLRLYANVRRNANINI